MNRTISQQEFSAPFRAKSAGLSLLAILMIGMYYFANLINLLPSEKAIPDGALSLALNAVVLIIIVQSALQIVLFIGAGKIEDRTELDDIVSMKATRNAHWVLSAGAMITFGSMFIEFTPFEMGSLLLLAFLISEVVQYGSQVFYYQRLA